MSDSNSSMPNLFRSLRADSTSVPTVGNSATNTAEQRWPILKSFLPVKLDATVPLTEDEKNLRRHVEAMGENQHTTETKTPGVNSQLAKGLSRMLVQKQTSIAPVNIAPTPKVAAIPTPVAVPAKETVLTASSAKNLFLKTAQARPQVEALAATPAATPAKQDDSLRAVLMRLEQAHQVPGTPAPRPPGFLSRLGKR
jgi:hypothetical protein